MLAVALLVLGVCCRFITHVPNFTPVIAIALFSGMYVNKKYAVLLPLALMLATDVFLGFYKSIFFVWASIAVISIVGISMREKRNSKVLAGASLASAILFFVVTNFGVWIASGMYPHTFAGLSRCFYLAIPFFRYTLLSTVVYSFVLFSAYEVLTKRLAVNHVSK